VCAKSYGQGKGGGEGVTPPPVSPYLSRAITLPSLGQMGQERSLSATTRHVHVENGLARLIWSSDDKVTPFGSSGVQMVKELGDSGRGWVVFQTPRLFGVPLHPTRGGLPNPTAYTIGGVGLPPHSLLEPW